MSTRAQRELPAWLNVALVGGALGALLIFERRRPLRKQTQNGLQRDARNLTIAAIAGASTALAQGPFVLPLARRVERRRWGLLNAARVPEPLKTLLAVALMDYTLYVWHYLTHKSRFLWRFHEAHHVDLDLSTTTAIRFHFGELVLSVPWRMGQVLAIGVSPRAFSIWQTTTMLAILFHHSNLRLPLQVEKWLSRILVTPRMHGIHHSVVKGETDSNWSTIFSFSDRLHGTLRLNVPQDEITIGVPAYRDERDVTLRNTLALPFRRQLSTWTRPGQAAPERGVLTQPVTRLAT